LVDGEHLGQPGRVKQIALFQRSPFDRPFVTVAEIVIGDRRQSRPRQCLAGVRADITGAPGDQDIYHDHLRLLRECWRILTCPAAGAGPQGAEERAPRRRAAEAFWPCRAPACRESIGGLQPARFPFAPMPASPPWSAPPRDRRGLGSASVPPRWCGYRFRESADMDWASRSRDSAKFARPGFRE